MLAIEECYEILTETEIEIEVSCSECGDTMEPTETGLCAHCNPEVCNGCGCEIDEENGNYCYGCYPVEDRRNDARYRGCDRY